MPNLRFLAMLAVVAVLATGAAAVGAVQRAQEKPRVHRDGAALPGGAIARLGSLEWRHGISLVDLALSPDGKTLVTVASPDNRWDGDEIRLWDLRTGKVTRALGHRWTLCAVFSADGSKLASCSVDGSVCLWNAADGKRLWTYPGNSTNTPFCLAFSPDGKQLVVGNRGLDLLDVATGKLRRTVAQEPANLNFAVAFAPDSTMIAAIEAQSVRLWNAQTGEVVRTMQGQASASGIAFSSDGKRLIAAGFKDVLIWETATGKLLQKLEGHTGEIASLAISRTGKYVAAGGGGRGAIRHAHGDHTIRIWDLSTGKAVHALPGHAHDIRGLCFTPVEQTLISADAVVRFWDVATGKQVRLQEGHEDEIVALGFDRDGKKLITVGLDGTARSWDARSGAQLQVSVLGKQRLDQVALSPAGTLVCGLAQDGDDRTAVVFDTATGKPMAQVPAAADVDSVALTTLGDRLCLLGRPVRTFDFKQAAVVKTPVELDSWDAQIDPRGRFVLTASRTEDALILKDLRHGSEYHRIAAVRSTQPRFSPDGRTLLVQVGHDATALWEIASGRVRSVLDLKISHQPLPPVWSFDGRHVAFCSGRGLQLWDMPAKRAVAGLTAPREWLMRSCWSNDGRLLAAATDHGTVLVWDMAAIRSAAGKGKAAVAVTPKRLAALWHDLAAPDAALAYRASWELRDGGAAMVAPLLERLRQVPVPDFRAIDKLLADVDSDEFDLRDKATSELATMGPIIIGRVQAALERKPSLETKRRLEVLRHKATGPISVPELLRVVRCIEVLENVSGPEARKALAVLAGGPAEHFVTEEARRGLQRLEQWDMRK